MYVFHNKVYQKNEEQAKIVFSGGKEYELGPAPEFGGQEGLLSPEDMLVGSVNSCLMMTFFYFIRKDGINILSYDSQAAGTVEKGRDGLRFTKIEVNATVVIESAKLSEKVENFGQLAEKYCLVSNSLSCEVEYNLQVQVH